MLDRISQLLVEGFWGIFSLIVRLFFLLLRFVGASYVILVLFLMIFDDFGSISDGFGRALGILEYFLRKKLNSAKSQQNTA